MAGFGPDKVVLPVGTDANRPASPSNGFMRYNTDRDGVEMYTQAGWIIGGGEPGTLANPATSGTALYNAGYTTTGNYYLDGGSGSYYAYIKMDQGGGWINVNTGNPVYSTLLSGGAGTGGTDPLTGSSATGTSLLNAGEATQNQAGGLGCPGENGKAYVDLNSTFATDFGISEVRMKIQMVSHSSVTCGPYWTTIFSGTRTIISGAAAQIDTRCNNSPNRYSDVAGTAPFTVEFYGPLTTATRVFQGWTACGGSYVMKLLEMYVR